MLPLAFGLLALATAPGVELADDDRWRAAQRHFDAFEYRAALDALQPLLGDTSLSAAERARAAILAGLSHAELAASDDAVVRFTLALTLDEHATLPAGTSPIVVALFERARAEAARARPTRATGLLQPNDGANADADAGADAAGAADGAGAAPSAGATAERGGRETAPAAAAAPAAADAASAPLVTGAAVVLCVGGVAALALGAWGLHLDAALGDAQAEPSYRALALDLEPIVLVGAAAGALLAAAGGTVMLIGGGGGGDSGR